MINAKELRMGNYVKDFTGRIGTVLSFTEKKIKVKMPHSTLNVDTAPSLEGIDIQPIPLTPDVLEAAGFVWETPKKSHLQLQMPKQGINKRNLTFYYKDGVCEILQLFMEDYIDGYFELAPPKYLHQLQNLFYSLTGTELEIKIVQKA